MLEQYARSQEYLEPKIVSDTNIAHAQWFKIPQRVNKGLVVASWASRRKYGSPSLVIEILKLRSLLERNAELKTDEVIIV